MFGDARLLEALAGGGTLSATDLAARVMQAVQAFSQEPPTDDIALLAIRNARVP